ncbi:MAG: hypothetical protein IOD12_14280, partial [Silvanigrellales bacterium]|nr:hypothetical protein [Silvanigrellales bacterium]
MNHRPRARSHHGLEGTILLSMTAIGSLLAISCGAQDAPVDQTSGRETGTLQSGLADNGPAGLNLQAAAAGDLACPQGSTLDTSGSKLCVVGNDALGPFSFGMKEKCREAGGGNACEGDRWSLPFARNLRGTSVCPPGATQSDRGVCVEGTLAFGPFTQGHVESCLKLGGGEPCTDSLQWNAAFANATAPTPPVNTSLPWKWISGLDHGLRTDGCGAGDFLAARGGGTRLHKGL